MGRECSGLGGAGFYTKGFGVGHRLSDGTARCKLSLGRDPTPTRHWELTWFHKLRTRGHDTAAHVPQPYVKTHPACFLEGRAVGVVIVDAMVRTALPMLRIPKCVLHLVRIREDGSQ